MTDDELRKLRKKLRAGQSLSRKESWAALDVAAEVLRLRETEAALDRDLSDALNRESVNLARAVAAEDEARALRAEVTRLRDALRRGRPWMNQRIVKNDDDLREVREARKQADAALGDKEARHD